MDLCFATLSDVGRVRSGNEDRVFCQADPHGQRGHLVVVADGMGGADAGEIASGVAVDTVAEVYFGSTAPPPTALPRAIAEANARILRAPLNGLGADGMGTTCTILAFVGAHAYLASVGDSRAYHIRGPRLTRLTRDESVWADDVRDGGEPRNEYGRNQLTRAVGLESQLEPPAVQEIALRGGDRFVLCSDGLWGLVIDYEILALSRSGGLPDVCRRLVTLANRRGGHDNVTVALAEVQG